MPRYCYLCSECEKENIHFCSFTTRPDTIVCEFCGAVAVRNIVLELRRISVRPSGNWPMHSDGAGVHPRQRDAAYRESVKMGVPTGFDERGRAIFETQKHRKDYCEANFLHDNDGGYGDPAPCKPLDDADTVMVSGTKEDS